MWLLHTVALELKAFMEGSIPKYAVLSHTWGEEEVTFREIQDLNIARTRKGWRKIKKCCQRASKDGYVWVWIDTCCIDKSSSAELSEAINSMWQYYKDAKECYAFLADVPLPSTPVITKNDLLNDVKLQSKQVENDWQPKLSASRWFTRGWTLQELLAPATVLFLAQDWSPIGRKEGLIETLQSITGIESKFLRGHPLEKASIAHRMSWAAKRITTRTEDTAYCLLGIFDLNMPLLYGEGKKAFKRLQLELLRTHVDQTIFAWTFKPPPGTGTPRDVTSVLAESPSWFAECGNVVDHSKVYGRTPFNLTNAGVQLTLQVGPLPSLKQASSYEYVNQDLRITMLACSRINEDKTIERVGICLRIAGSVKDMADAMKTQNPGNKKFTDFAVRAFPDYIHSDFMSFAWPLKTIYLQY